MTQGHHISHEFEAMVELVIKERRIALPAERLIWYAKWFGLDIRPRTCRKALCKMVRDRKLVVIKDGKFRYYKLRVNVK